ncbi:N-terminal acetyltransferase B complex auxiliary subunit NAA25-like isoform X2 [Papaver somniferum]|uniref:N-terminal acetyltransferase B complex auxiliary subunit NAA25-like isoform X2 n=1 Tax=Papaver somniferum TaxID=3469 RepID=UPI000E6FC04F|nr:N-terminal acetyltransferase B complex auxiliary subunit NAA25-like isoform X2 [Papaver somniferum]
MEEGTGKQDQMEEDKLQEQIVYFPKRERFKFELEASSSTDLISSLPDQPSSKSRKLEEHSLQASPAAASSRSVIPKNRIQLVKDSIESRQFIKALQLINALQSEFPPSPLVLALKALVYEKIASKVEVLSICSDAKDHMVFDFSSLPDVLATLDIVFQRLGRLDLATEYYEHACEKVDNSLELLRGLFNCYARQSSFAKQLKVCLRMYMIVQEDKFLYWAVFCVQLQVLFHLFKKHGMDHNLDEPEAFLVYMSVMEQPEMYGPVHEILCKLGPTLIVVKADKQDFQERKLLAHLCDYVAAVEALKKILWLRCPNDWESLIHEIDFSVEDDSNYMYFACKISVLPKKHCGSQILEALSNLENKKKICRFDRKDNDVFEEAIYEYFTRVNYRIQRFFQIFSKGEVYWLVDSLLKQDVLTAELLKEKFSMICNIPKIPKHFGDFCVGFKPAVHGATIVIKTSKFIVIAADGELTSRSSDNALFLNSEKIRQFDDLCIAISGVWKTLSKTVSVVHKCMRHLKKNGEGRRPTVRQISEYMAKEDPMLNGEFEVIICAFDELEVGKPLVPCASFAGNFFSWDPNQSIYCSGRCSSHAECILLEGNIGPDTGLAEVICWVERALVYTAMFDSCTGGLATITVIDADKKVKVMAEEYIHTTLWEKHRHFFENRKTKLSGFAKEER